MSFRQGARQFFEKRGAPTPPLPYDAEVEYIESVRPAYIDTGIRYLTTYTVYLDAQFVNPGRNLDTCLGSSGDAVCTIRVWPGVNQIQSFWYSGFLSVTQDANELYKRHRYEFGPNGMRFDENQVTTRPPPRDTVESLKLAGYNEGNTERQGACRFWSFKVSDGNTLLIDLIPVRFTNEQGMSEGAMYDRVSGQVFRNAGTGAFTIGPDKS